MAEFGVQATQLSAPSGSGANPIAPATANILGNGVGNLLGNIANIFEKGLELTSKDQAKQQEAMIVNTYARKLGTINDAVASGQMDPREASTRQRALHSEYVAGYSQFVDKFDSVRKSFFSGSTLGDVEEKQKTEADLRKQRISDAQKAGFPITSGMGDRAVDAFVDAHQTAVRADAEMQRFYREQEANRSAARFSNEVLDRERKEKSLAVINEIAGTNLDASATYVQDILERRKSGKLDQKSAELEWEAYNMRLNAQLQAAASLNPELAAPYRSLFNDMQTVGRKLLDPEADVKLLENQVKQIIATKKILALSKPGVASAAALNSLFPVPEVALQYSADIVRAAQSMGSSTPNSDTPAPAVVGNAELEQGVFKIASENMKAIQRGEVKDPKAIEATRTTVNNTLEQVGMTLARPGGANAKALANAANFISSPEFGAFVAANKLSPDAQRAAVRAFQAVYEPAVIDGISKAVNRVFEANTGLVPARAATGAKLEPVVKAIDPKNFTITFSDSSVKFDVKEMPKDPIERRQVVETLAQLRKAEQVATQLVRMNAHLEGKVDYGAVWERDKSKLFPSMFSSEQAQPAKVSTDGKYAKEADLSALTKLTPQEEARAAKQEASPSNLAELDKEIARTKNPEAKKVLEDYRNRLVNQKGK